MIRLLNISKQFYEANSSRHQVIDSLSYEFNDTGLYFITGPSGCGKSTLLNLMAGFLKPDEGDIYYDDICINRLDDKKEEELLRERLSFVFQDYNLIESLTVYENLIMPLKLSGLPYDENKANEILIGLGIAKLKNRRINKISGGERQRVGIARALMRKSKVILCDEPTGALDRKNANIVMSYLKEISKDRLVIVVSHNLKLANEYGDKLLELKNGRLAEDQLGCKEGSTVELANSLGDDNSSKPKRISPILQMSNNYLFKGKVKLALSILFIVASFIALSLTISFEGANQKETIVNAMVNSDEHFISLVNNRTVSVKHPDNDSITTFNDEGYSYEAVAELQRDINSSIIPTYNYFTGALPNIGDSCRIQISGFTELNKELISEYALSLYGSYPLNDSEVAISRLQYEAYKAYGFIEDNNKLSINSYDDLIGHYIELSINDEYKRSFKITGIIDTYFNYAYYKDLDKLSEEERDNRLRLLYDYLKKSLHTTIFLNEGFYENNLKLLHDTYIYENIYIYKQASDRSNINGNSSYDGIKNGGPDNIATIDLGYPGILVSFNDYYGYVDPCREYADTYAYEVFPMIKDEFLRDYEEATSYKDYENYLIENNYCDLRYKPITKEEFRRQAMLAYVEKHKVGNEKYCISSNELLNPHGSDRIELPIGGFYYGSTDSNFIYLNNEGFKMVSKAREPLNYDIGFISTPNYKNKSKSKDILYKLYEERNIGVDYGFYEALNSFSSIDNSYTTAYYDIDEVASAFDIAFIIVGVISFVLFIIFLLLYINGIIYDRRRELGIMKIMGIPDKAIYKIFITLGLTLALICSGLILIIEPLVAMGFNSMLVSGYEGLIDSYFILGGIEYASSVIVPAVLILIMALIPIHRLLKKPYLEIIKNK